MVNLSMYILEPCLFLYPDKRLQESGQSCLSVFKAYGFHIQNYKLDLS